MSTFDLAKQWSRLQALRLEASATLSTSMVDESVRGAASGALDTYSVQVEKLGPTGEWGLATLQGNWTEAKWIGLANEVGAALTSLINDVADSSISIARVWSEIVLPTAVEASADVRQAGAQLAAEGPGLFKWGVVAVVAVAVIFVASKVR